MGVSSSASADNDKRLSQWMRTSRLSSKMIDDKLVKLSSGFQSINNNVIIKTSSDENIADGARWSRGFSKGRHIFEIGFPKATRGKHASVGVGSKLAPLKSESNTALVGSTGDSWGIDLSSCQTVHNNKSVSKFPKGFRRKMPDRFFMYLDLKDNALYFGADERYFGAAFTNLDPAGSVLYPIVSATSSGATISVVYRGKGKGTDGPIRKKR